MTPQQMEQKLRLYEDSLQAIMSELWHQAVMESEMRDDGALPVEIEPGNKASRLTILKIAVTALRHQPQPAMHP